MIASEFLARQSEALGRSLSFAPGVISFLKSQLWPGNIRELERAIERAAVLAEGSQVTLEDFEMVSQPQGPADRSSLQWTRLISRTPLTQGTNGSTGVVTGASPIKEMERETILEVLAAHHGNRTHTAKALGMSLRTLRHKLKQYRESGFDTRQKQAEGLGKNRREFDTDAPLVTFLSTSRPGDVFADVGSGEKVS